MASPGDKVYPTPAQLRAVGVWVQAEGLITGLDYEEGYDANELVTSDTFALSITEESARAAGHAVEDLSIEVQVPTVDSEDCVSHYTFAGLNFAHRVDVSVYGPHPALAHTDWIGTGGAGTPNSAGEFTVEASGTPTLTLTIPNNFEQIQAEAPYEDFPEGGPVVPLSYWYHRADYWSAAYGAERPKSHVPWDATWEGVYCWRGWGWLKTRLKVPADSSLTLSFAGKTLIPTDNHYAGTDNETGENRQTGYSATWTQWIASSQPHLVVNGQLVPVEVVPQSEDCTVYWRICLDVNGQAVDPEVVNTVALSGMADGDWQLLEPPRLTLDPTADVHAVIKVFEAAAQCGDEHHTGSSYRKGGISAVVDYAHWRTLYWGDGSNANLAEECGGIFDKLISPNYEIDYTTAWTVAQYADIISACSDAWEVTVDGAACAAALKDADDNEIPVWAFDIREDQITPPTAPLEQDVDGGAALVAIRCGSWKLARGILCKPVVDKVIGGRAHGALYDDQYALLRECADRLILWRSDDGATWAAAGITGTSDSAGRWCTGSLHEFVASTTPQSALHWGISDRQSTAPDVTWARAPHREYLRSDHNGALTLHYDPAMTYELGGIVWMVTTNDPAGGKLAVAWSGAQDQTHWVAVTTPSAEAVFVRPSIAVVESALVVTATDVTAAKMRVFRSFDRGRTWSEVA